MQVPIKLNRAQAYKLYEKFVPLGKGRPHWRRIQRLYDVFRCEDVEDVIEHNNDLRKTHRAAAISAANEKRTIPPEPEFAEVRNKEPVQTFMVDEGDLEYLHRKTREWDKEGADAPDSNEWSVLLPALDAIDDAWEVCEKLKAAKSNGEVAEKAPEAENAAP